MPADKEAEKSKTVIGLAIAFVGVMLPAGVMLMRYDLDRELVKEIQAGIVSFGLLLAGYGFRGVLGEILVSTRKEERGEKESDPAP